ncbi:MAG: hypothetical protein M1818_003692 [Claussenomyces sp. TS43310]|nr:MAG: hypothetical protein M1818_003692 [Claussenomyces sp. TS43310]
MSGGLDSSPDLMNDPQYATNIPGGDDSVGDGDTCRICRGEGTQQEPLFFPCKCNGSIKFVHQDCLMEWLSHSQKKHCELCKTPFRFTKLYSPTMPQSLPLHIFLRHLIIRSVRNVAIWLRFCLVLFVWLGCLPWGMRYVWDFLFWFGDGGWSISPPPAITDGDTTGVIKISMLEQELLSMEGNGTCRPNPLMALPMNSARLGPVVEQLTAVLQSKLEIQDVEAFANGSSGFIRATVSAVKGAAGQHHVANLTDPRLSFHDFRHAMAARSSLLSDVGFLKNLTSSPRINKILVTTVEGQIITIIVVVCFILIFLIREWVVQQQPGINMGAGFEAELAAGARFRNALQDDVPNAEDLPRHRAQRPDAEIAGRRHVGLGGRPIARPRRGMARGEDRHDDNADAARREVEEDDYDAAPNAALVQRASDSDQGGLRNRRPTMPTRDAQTSAAEIQRRLADASTDTSESTLANEFISIWQRASGSPEEVLKIIETEGLDERLRYWKSAMATLDQSSSKNAVPQSSAHDEHLEVGDTDGTVVRPMEGTDSTGASWEDVQEPIVDPIDENSAVYPSNQDEEELRTSDKGKARAEESPSEPLLDFSNGDLPGISMPDLHKTPPIEVATWPSADSQAPVVFQSGSGRQRAISDGPRIGNRILPPTSNNWSFENLPQMRPASRTASSSQEASDQKSWDPAQELRFRDTIVEGSDASAEIPRRQSASIALARSTNHVEGAANTSDPLSGPVIIRDRGVTRTSSSWHEVFADNPISDSEDDLSRESRHGSSEERRTIPSENESPHPGAHLPATLPTLDPAEPLPVPPAAPAHGPPEGILGHVADWLWGDMVVRPEIPAGDDEHIVRDIAAEAPFVPVAQHHNGLGDNDNDGRDVAQDREVVAAALAAGIDPNDPDAMEDAEDFEGIMELVGMRGPLSGLVQNSLFSAVLISLTVACGVWSPYNVGRVVILLIANPIPTLKLPLKLVFGLAAILQDLALVVLGYNAYLLFKICMLPAYLYSFTVNGQAFSSMLVTPGLGLGCIRVASQAGERIADGFIGFIMRIPDSELPAFSAVSHEALLHIKGAIGSILYHLGSVTAASFSHPRMGIAAISSMEFSSIRQTLVELGTRAVSRSSAVLTLLAQSNSWVISLNTPERAVPIDPNLAHWSGTDRFWAILTGYITFSFLGAAYLRKGSPFSTSQTGREWEATLLDALNQAGGVMKVILIISIEMLIFPLYCGLLLDMALLPLFDSATMLSRAVFTLDTPFTSIFVHWFVGTCYMFHFALFVSMCRKIMRSGVLYFIKDPDDPTFHPVRDVLERNVMTQLRKITFSAMVYGALVVICLGGVVWGLAYTFKGVLPIHWSSNEPVLEFPIDLLFYNFFMPLAVKFFKPSDGLHAMYTWWFRQCARFLRLTWFLFDEQKEDEEGHHVRRSWRDVFVRAQGDVNRPVKLDDLSASSSPFDEDPTLRACFVRDGRYVRTPASDQVRLPKGVGVFLEVDRSNNRIDDLPDQEDGIHGRESEMFKMVYVPPHFRHRIFLFVLFIWLFAAVTGVGLTVVPLVFGRHIFSAIIPSHVQKNDVYAFSIGIYILGSAFYCLVHSRDGINFMRRSLTFDANTPINVLSRIWGIALWTLRLVYVYTAFALLLPTLFAFVVEFYFIIPLHMYFAIDEPHVIHFVQSWTLGLLYVKLTSRFILWHADSRPAEALRAVTRRGYWDPDIRIATRCFIVPTTIILSAALLVPFGLARLADGLELFGPGPTQQMLLYRQAYPLTLFFVCHLYLTWSLLGMLRGWRMMIRDEVYLIGERLHNFGDRSKSGAGALMPSSSRIET